MLSKFISLFLLVFFLAYINSGLFSYSLFKANQEEIIKDCCEKKVTNCDGKCYFNKSVAKNEKDTTGENEIQRINVSPVLYIEKIVNDLIINSKKSLFTIYNSQNTSNGHIFIEDKPPKI
ncbi:MAG TPA: hypothetical protein PKA90_16270 [Ignavibacteria bacterium]|nr:hypothetical protein [Ignavibacteria bacterium]HMR41973.1 hypothetical protein [Ignavibacteria bacterium]